MKGEWRPVPAVEHRGFGRPHRANAVTMLTVYLVLLLAIPSNVVIEPLGSLGRPSMLWGLLLFAWWVMARLQAPSYAVSRVPQPVRTALGALLIVALVSYASALLRGQPFDQVSPASTSMFRLFAWAGVLLVALEGVRTIRDLTTLVRRMTIIVSLLALLGMVQFVTGRVLVDFFGSIPGLEVSWGGVDARGDFTRAVGTATHPLEYAAALSAALPIAIAVLLAKGFRQDNQQGAWGWWLPVVFISVSSLLAVSRSAIIGFAVAVIGMIHAVPRAYRLVVVLGGAVIAGGIVVAVPGLFTMLVRLFAESGTDASTTSRTDGLARAPEFILTSPWFGAGFGTFLPRYYIFDNQWVLTTVELGILGVLALAAIFLAAIWSAFSARKRSRHADVMVLGSAFSTSVLSLGVLFAFFDGLSFPIAAGLFFLVAGLCGALRTIGEADHSMTSAAPFPTTALN